MEKYPCFTHPRPKRELRQCLTPRSSGAPTAGHQARSGGTRYIFASPGLASCRRRPLSSNVRHREVHNSQMRSLRNYPLDPCPAGRAASLKMSGASRCGFAWRLRTSDELNDNASSQCSPPALVPRPNGLNLKSGFSRRLAVLHIWPAPTRKSGSPVLRRSLGLRPQGAAPLSLERIVGSSFISRHLIVWLPAVPNTSFKPSPNGNPPGRRNSVGLHFLQRRPGGLPSVPA